MLRAMDRVRWPALVGLLVLALGAVDVWWLRRYRSGFPLDIDESGYLWFAFHLHDTARVHASALVHGFQNEGWVGPLLPATTAVVAFLGIGKSIVGSLAVQLVFFAILVFSGYGIGTHLRGRRAGAVTALSVAALPSVTDFVRTYHLVIASTAMLTFAVWALLASQRFARRGWSIAWGVGLGLTMLARGMMIAFVPSVLVGAVWLVLLDRRSRDRLVNLVLGAGAFVATTLLWYATSWRPILDYLTRAGYGQQSKAYGPDLSPLTTGFWTHETTGAAQHSLYLPLTVVLVAALAVGAVAVGRRAVPRLLRSDAIVLVLVVLEGYLALTSSSNDGTGFVVPLLPSLVALAVAAAWSVPWRSVRIGLVAALVAVSLFNIVMKADVLPGISRVHALAVPGWVEIPVTDGRGFVHYNLAGADGIALGSPAHWFPDGLRGWPRLYRDISSVLERRHAAWLHVQLAPQEPILNASALRFYADHAGFSAADFGYVDIGRGDSVGGYRAALAASTPEIVLTTSRAGNNFGPAPTPGVLDRALRDLRYRPIARFGTPDARRLEVWASPHA